MNSLREPDHELEDRVARRLLDVFIRVGLIFALVWLCFHFFAPFLTMMLWALILAVTLYPLQQMLAKRIGGKQGRAATLIVVLGLGLIVVPTVILGSSFGDSVHGLINGVKDNTLTIPAPPARVADVPIVGKKAHAVWSQAHSDLPALVKNMQPKIGELAGKALGIVASLGGGLLKFMFSFIVAGIMMAFGEPGGRAMQAIFERFAGIARGAEFTESLRASMQHATGVPCTTMSHAVLASLIFRFVPGTRILGPVLLAQSGLSACMARTVPAISIACRRTKHGAASPTAAPASNPCQQPVSRCASLARARSTASGTFAGQARG